jgi:Na+-driven multidrug efflux pump
MERIPKIIRFSLLANITFALLLSAITVFLPLKVFGLFTSDSKVLEMSLTYVACAVHCYFAFALRAPFFALIYGTGQSKLNLWVGILDGVICRIGLALFLGIVIGMGVRGFWYGSALAGYVPFLVGFAYYISGKWKTKKLLVKS